MSVIGAQPMSDPDMLSDQPIPMAEPMAMSRKEMEEIIQKVTTWQSQIQASRSLIEAGWNLNLSMYLGRQNMVPNQVLGINQLVNTRRPYWMGRAVYNYIRPLMRTELSKLTSQKPTAVVVPGSSDDADVFAAEAATNVWESMYQTYHIDAIIRQAAWWMTITGTGFIKNLWDPTAVDKISDQMGDLKVTAENPYHIFVPDLRCESIEEQPYLIHMTYRPVEEVRSTFSNVAGFDPSKVVADSKATDDPLSAVALGITSDNNRLIDTVAVYECWVRPGYEKKWPNGAFITVASGQLIQYMEGWPYEHGEYPFSKISGIPSGKFYADSTIVDLIPIQREINRTRNQIVEAKNRMAKPQLLAAKGSIDATKITSEPGQVIYYKVGLPKPEPLPLQGLPSYVMDELSRLYTDLENISGQHEVSRGQVPTGVTAGTAIAFLSEQDDAKLVPQVRSLEAAIEKTAHQLLSLANQYWDTDRIIKVVGRDGSFNSQIFKGSDLRGNTDVRVEAGSAMAGSKAGRQAFIMDLMKMQFVPPDIGLEMLELGNVNAMYERVKVDERQAQRENLKMIALPEQFTAEYLDNRGAWETMGGMDPETGTELLPPMMPVPINSFDDHGKHIDAHNRFRKSQSYEQLDDQHKAVIDQHVMAHVMALMGGDPATAAGSTQPLPDSPTQTQADPYTADPAGGVNNTPADQVTGSQPPQ